MSSASTHEPRYVWDARYACFRPAEHYEKPVPARDDKQQASEQPK